MKSHKMLTGSTEEHSREWSISHWSCWTDGVNVAEAPITMAHMPQLFPWGRLVANIIRLWLYWAALSLFYGISIIMPRRITRNVLRMWSSVKICHLFVRKKTPVQIDWGNCKPRCHYEGAREEGAWLWQVRNNPPKFDLGMPHESQE